MLFSVGGLSEETVAGQRPGGGGWTGQGLGRGEREEGAGEGGWRGRRTRPLSSLWCTQMHGLGD